MVEPWTIFWVVSTFGLYIFIAIRARASSTEDFYVAGHDVHPIINGMATGADWMSAASFLSMAGLIAGSSGNSRSPILWGIDIIQKSHGSSLSSARSLSASHI